MTDKKVKEITFRPLRRVKKTGKIVVASYPQWYRVQTADYGKFELIIDDEYKNLPVDEIVHDHTGEPLFFFAYNPADIPVFRHSVLLDLDKVRRENKYYGILWEDSTKPVIHASGTDCMGTPCFSHYTSEQIINAGYKDMSQFEVLTVGKVVKWLGWFLYSLQNSYLQIGK